MTPEDRRTQEHGRALGLALADFISQQPPPIPPKVLLIALGKMAAACFANTPDGERETLANRWIKQILWIAEHQAKP